MSNSVRPQRWQPTRLPCPWDSPGKNTGVGCHFLLQCMKVKSESEVTQPCPTQRPHGLQPTRLLRPWDFPGRVLEWGAIAFSVGLNEAFSVHSSNSPSAQSFCLPFLYIQLIPRVLPEWTSCSPSQNLFPRESNLPEMGCFSKSGCFHTFPGWSLLSY